MGKQAPTPLAALLIFVACPRVPTLVFITPPSTEGSAYDVRFWKIAFHLPEQSRIL